MSVQAEHYYPTCARITHIFLLSLPSHNEHFTHFLLELFQSLLWLYDITMRVVVLSFYAVLFNQCVVRAHMSLLSRPSISKPPPTEALKPRQAPGVVGTSEFLRRGYQACKC